MPPQCCVCGRFKGPRDSKFKPVTSSVHETAFRPHIKYDTSQADPPRPMKACAGCYKSVMHADNTDAKVVVLPSSLGRYAGRGVFAHKELEFGSIATEYSGMLVDRTIAREMPMPETHVASVRGLSIFVRDGKIGRKMYGDGYGSLVNRVPRGTKPNCRIVQDPHDVTKAVIRVGGRASVRKTQRKPIKPGAEYLTTYGPSYRMPKSAAKERKSKAGRPSKRARPSQLDAYYRHVMRGANDAATRADRHRIAATAGTGEEESGMGDDSAVR